MESVSLFFLSSVISSWAVDSDTSRYIFATISKQNVFFNEKLKKKSDMNSALTALKKCSTLVIAIIIWPTISDLTSITYKN